MPLAYTRLSNSAAYLSNWLGRGDALRANRMKISPKDGNVALSFCVNCDMLFNSFIFLVFFAVCFMLFWIGMSKKKGVWNEFLLLSSYFFYAWWDWRFLGLVVFSSVVDISKVPQLSTDSVYVFRKLIRQEVRLLQLESLAI
jgi:hypothetical protein